jgi:cysteinyl-tRNA synthetase
MSTKYLGQQFDIHGGGMDLKFPHHECEIAQNVGATGDEPVKYWMHGNMLTVNGRKMAKSEGNGFTPEELISGNHKLLDKGYSPMTVRFFFMTGHYASTLDFSNEALQAAEKGYKRMVAAKSIIQKLNPSETSGYHVKELSDKCREAMNDDFNTPIVISHLFEAVRVINSAHENLIALAADDIKALQDLFDCYFTRVMGLRDEISTTAADDKTSGLMSLILDIRSASKARKDFATSDKIRDTLATMGISIRDTKEGATWEMEN